MGFMPQPAEHHAGRPVQLLLEQPPVGVVAQRCGHSPVRIRDHVVIPDDRMAGDRPDGAVHVNVLAAWCGRSAPLWAPVSKPL